METHILARQGHTAQSLQLYDGGLHTIAVTVRPVGGEVSGWVPPTAVLSLDVVALHPPLAVQIRMMAILPGVLVWGMVVGFFVPRTYNQGGRVVPSWPLASITALWAWYPRTAPCG